MSNPHIARNVISYHAGDVTVTPAPLPEPSEVPDFIQSFLRMAKIKGFSYEGVVPQGGTGYLDSFERAHLPHRISYGRDEFDREFVALRTGIKPLVVHQRYASHQRVWVTAGLRAVPLCYSNAEELVEQLMVLMDTGRSTWCGRPVRLS